MSALRSAAATVLVLALATGCGSRAGDAEIRAGAGGSDIVTLDQKSLDALRAVVGPRNVAATGAPVGVAGSVPASAPASGRKTPPGRVAATPSGPATAAPATPQAHACADVATPVNLGQIGSFGGVAGPLTTSTRTALAIWAKDVNARGGLACHPINLYAVDDGGDPSRAAALVGDLVNQHHVQALVGVISFGLAGIIPAIEREKLPVVGGELVAPQWFAHPEPKRWGLSWTARQSHGWPARARRSAITPSS